MRRSLWMCLILSACLDSTDHPDGTGDTAQTPTGGTDSPVVTDPDDDDDGVTVGDGDCDDDDATVFPGAEEDCTLVDRNCDGDPTNGHYIELAGMVTPEGAGVPYKKLSHWYDPTIELQIRPVDAQLVQVREFEPPSDPSSAQGPLVEVKVYNASEGTDGTTLVQNSWNAHDGTPTRFARTISLHDDLSGWYVETTTGLPSDDDLQVHSLTRREDGIILREEIHGGGPAYMIIEHTIHEDLSATGELMIYDAVTDEALLPEPVESTMAYDEHGQPISFHQTTSFPNTHMEWRYDGPDRLTGARAGNEVDGEMVWDECYTQTWADGRLASIRTYDAANCVSDWPDENDEAEEVITFTTSCVVRDDFRDTLVAPSAL